MIHAGCESSCRTEIHAGHDIYGESTRLRHSRRDRFPVTQRRWRPLTHCCLQCNFPPRHATTCEGERDMNALARDQGEVRRGLCFHEYDSTACTLAPPACVSRLPTSSRPDNDTCLLLRRFHAELRLSVSLVCETPEPCRASTKG